MSLVRPALREVGRREEALVMAVQTIRFKFGGL